MPPATVHLHEAGRPRGRRRGEAHAASVLSRYTDEDGEARELIARAAHEGSTLVVDRPVGGGTELLLAHLGADEPSKNALIVARSFLAADAAERRCRELTPGDARRHPFPRERAESVVEETPAGTWPAVAGPGCVHRIELVAARMSIPQLRWTRRTPAGGAPREVSLRDAIATLESYEPLCAISRRAIARHREDGAVSTTVLRAELTRVLESPIVLNRGLREAVLSSIEHDQTSMSEIAKRCGRVKRDARGCVTGETSWLARRIGLLPEGGQSVPTRWVHSDVLALIARRGLGISPHEVELG
jgi:hypothetical protein